jgi:hypothetical protein
MDRGKRLGLNDSHSYRLNFRILKLSKSLTSYITTDVSTSRALIRMGGETPANELKHV